MCKCGVSLNGAALLKCKCIREQFFCKACRMWDVEGNVSELHLCVCVFVHDFALECTLLLITSCTDGTTVGVQAPKYGFIQEVGLQSLQ